MRRLAAAAASSLSLLALALLTACTPPQPARVVGPSDAQATWTPPTGPGPALTPVTFAHLPGWRTDKLAEAMPRNARGGCASAAPSSCCCRSLPNLHRPNLLPHSESGPASLR